MAGPLAGLGVAPAAGGLFNELAATTRRAFVPRLFVQIYYSSPSLFYMMGNAQRAAGGLNQAPGFGVFMGLAIEPDAVIAFDLAGPIQLAQRAMPVILLAARVAIPAVKLVEPFIPFLAPRLVRAFAFDVP